MTTELAEPARPRAMPAPLRRLRDLTTLPRIMGVDVARGIAVIGMIGAHVGITETFDWARIETWTDVVHGRSSLLFAFVAGISIALLTGRTRRPALDDLPTLRLRLVGRGAVVFALGVALELLNTGVAVILTVYGVLFVAIIPFLRWRRRSLWIGAAGLAVLGPLALELARTLSVQAWGPGLDLVLFGTYPVTVWLALLLAGLAVGRSDLPRVRTALALLVGGAVLAGVGYGTASLVEASARGGSASGASFVDSFAPERSSVAPDELPSALVCDLYGDGTASCYDPSAVPVSMGGSSAAPSYAEQIDLAGLPQRLLDALTSASPHSGGTLEIVGAGGLAAAIVGASLLLSRPLRWPLVPLAALGSMPLTAYAAHVVVILLTGGLMAAAPDGSLWPALSIGLLVATTLWAALLGAGPLERLTRRASSAMAGARPARTARPSDGSSRDEAPARVP